MGSETHTNNMYRNDGSTYNLDNHTNVKLSDEQTFNNKSSNNVSHVGNTVNGNVDNMQGLHNSAGGSQVFKLINLNNPAD